MENINIFWFRRDLRLNDNAGLYRALKKGIPVLPIFIFDQNILSQLPKNDARVTFIHDQLSKIQSQLQKIGKSLAVFYGDPFEVYNRILAENNIKTVYTNHDYEPYAIRRDSDIEALLLKRGVNFNSYKDQSTTIKRRDW